MIDSVPLHVPQQKYEETNLFPQGVQLENPYTVENMLKAYDNLFPSSVTRSNERSKIKTTHLYVRFKPATEKDIYILEEKRGLDLWDKPLDREYPKERPGGYHDPSIAKGEITWQYTVVPADYGFEDGISHEIIDELYLQDLEEGPEVRSRETFPELMWIDIQNESFRLTGNEEDIIDKGFVVIRGSKWYPDGYFFYEDNSGFGKEPAEGLRVKVRSWFKSSSLIVASNGYFKSNKGFTNDNITVEVKYERHDWDIRSGSYGQAYSGEYDLYRSYPRQIYFTQSAERINWYYANIHIGANDYFTKHNSYGLRYPYHKTNHTMSRLHIGAKDKSGRAHFFDFNNIWLAAELVMYYKNTLGDVNESRELYTQVTHELAHAAHWEYSGTQDINWAFTNIGKRYTESWAQCVGWYISKARYGDDDGWFENQQTRSLTYIKMPNHVYTPLAIDMIDARNQSQENSSRPNDQVSGYSLYQLEQALPGNLESWYGWRNNIKSMYSNSTEQHIDYLFSEYLQ